MFRYIVRQITGPVYCLTDVRRNSAAQSFGGKVPERGGAASREGNLVLFKTCTLLFFCRWQVSIPAGTWLIARGNKMAVIEIMLK